MALSSGTRLGPYEILSVAGSGGMGEVYRAKDTRLDRIVAIKVLPESLLRDPGRRQRLEREARAVSSLSHPHICTLHDVGHQDTAQGPVDYLVMEYLEGETLAERLQKGPLPPDQVLRYALEIAGALDAAHRQGIIHRDLKPGNIMLTGTGAKLLDFGVAKAAPPAAGENLTAAATRTTPATQQGTVVGTLPYMSPEQVEGKDVDARSDIFSFGLLLYEMVTGRRALGGDTHAQVLAAILRDDPPPIRGLRPDVGDDVEQVLRRCLQKDPTARYPDAATLLEDLRACTARLAMQSSGWQTLRRPRVFVPVAVVVLAAVAFSAWTWRRSESVFRDYSREEPVGDAIFTAYRSLHRYDAAPLEARTESSETDSEHWREERVSYAAAYDGERIPATLFLPKNAVPPYQAVLYFPPGSALRLHSIRDAGTRQFAFLVRSGRAVLSPGYKGTYERRLPPGAGGPNASRDIVIQWSKDVGRSLDYLEGRPDIDRKRLAFYGLSMGAQFGPIAGAVEPRFRALVLVGGGLSTEAEPPEVDALNFAPRVRVPVLMINGSHDFIFPLETSQKPLFRLLALPENAKRHYVFDGGHVPPRLQEVARETLDWLDRHLGPVRTTVEP